MKNIIKKCKVYSDLALIYDFVMRHVNYREWAEYIKTLINVSGMEVKTILDISCGTSSLGLQLLELGYEVYGFDYSYDMVFQGIKKIREKNKELLLWCGDMSRFYYKREFDAIICVYDSINYLMKEDQWLKVFNCVYDTLKPGGLFIFDISTEANSLRYFKDSKEKVRGAGFRYTRICKYNQKDRIQINEFHIHWKHKPSYVSIEKHEQIVIPFKRVIKLIPASKFILLGKYHDFMTIEANEISNRIHFLLKKYIQ